jgi:uncharacterized protein YaaQ
MKLIIAILRDIDLDPVTSGLTEAGYRVTHIASTGGFLRRGSTTLLVGLDPEQVEPAIRLIREHCNPPSEPGQKRGTIFVVPVESAVSL